MNGSRRHQPPMLRASLAALVMLLFAGCASTPMLSKQDAFPAMYGSERPVSILVLPAINRSTAADAGSLLDVTVAEPFANHGYYVMPLPITSDLFERDGIVDGDQLLGIPGEVFRDSFGADAVMYITIENWETNYIVVAGNVTVGMSYVLKSTTSEEILWSYKGRVVVDTSGSSGNILADMVATAITTATADYVPVAIQVHLVALTAMPFGGYHPQSGLDGEAKVVNAANRDSALAP
ncbi:MAG TPA: GNA1162 family protein [Pseudomonadales bacterium]|nr:GNA1162 family protein [Pseudomonadales bacterium]